MQIEYDRNWRETDADWACPCCLRPKEMLLKPKKMTEQLVASLASHHDHFKDVMKNFRRNEIPPSRVYEIVTFLNSLRRFDRVVICQDCNLVDAVAKTTHRIHPAFSFTSHEISQMIFEIGKAGLGHKLDKERSLQIWEQEREAHLANVEVAKKFIASIASSSVLLDKNLLNLAKKVPGIWWRVSNGRATPSDQQLLQQMYDGGSLLLEID